MRTAAVMFAIVLGLLLQPVPGAAQSLTTGAIQGRVTDRESEESLPFVTVTVGTQSVTCDEEGNYKVTDLIPGTYDVQFEFDTTTATRTGIVINANSVTNLNMALKIGEAIRVDGTPPPIRTTRNDKVTTVDRDQLTSLPVPGTSFDDATGQTPGSQNDGTGTALSGSSGLENRYLVDGIDITGLTIGDVGTPVLNEFVHEIQIVSGGYNAEYGRATGGIINVITRSGTDTLRGSVFGQLTPGLFTARRHVAPSNSSSIDITGDNAYSGQMGFELGGPIVEKRAWFYLGAAPQSSRTDFTRTTKRQTDCRVRLDSGELSTCDAANADGVPDLDPKTGFYITDTLDSEVRSSTARSTQVIGKVNALVTPNNQVQLSVIALPSSSESPALSGLPSTGRRSWGLTTDSAARWTAKLGDGATEIEGIATWHRSTYNSGSIDPSFDSTPLQVLYGSDLSRLSSLGGESANTAAGCTDNVTGSDPYPLITNCPMNTSYTIGGPGAMASDKEERFGARASVVHRFKALGGHELKTGLDYEDNRKRTARLYSGGALIQNFGSSLTVNRYVEVAPPGSMDPSYDKICTTPDPSGGTGGSANAVRELTCRYVGGSVGEPGTLVDGHTLNWGTYLQDSWQPFRSLVLNAGVRYEEQRLQYAARLRGSVDALTGNRLGTQAMTLRGNVSPRLGVIWDPTEENRSKIFAAWGRYFEAIPMDINDRSFGGELAMTQTFDPGACGGVDQRTGFADGTKCLSGVAPQREELIGSSGVLIAPGIKAQYMDETLLGGEIALPSNVVVGLTAQHRRLGRVIEDVSTDGANTYIIANPGEWSETEEARLVHAIATATDKGTRDRLERDLQMFRGIRIFDRPQRNYMALELTLSRRFMSGLYLAASYTHSRTEGNYPGLVSYDNGQIDPNISSQYDLIELLGNRRGRLPQDRPHYVKVDAYRGFDVGEGKLTVGTRVRMLSGIPRNALAAHYLYGANEAFLLPRGQLGRTALEHGLDIHVGYKKQLHAGVDAELFIDVFNIYNRQGTFRVDDTYAPQYSLSGGGSGGIEQNGTPISGGTYEDLLWAKSMDRNGSESSQPLGRNPNFGRTTSRYAPASAQVGFRVTF